jgi:hypothetical protein
VGTTSSTLFRVHDWAIDPAAAARPCAGAAKCVPSELRRTESRDLGDITHFYVSAEQVRLRLHDKR